MLAAKPVGRLRLATKRLTVQEKDYRQSSLQIVSVDKE